MKDGKSIDKVREREREKEKGSGLDVSPLSSRLFSVPMKV
jgi:hypothetical protein